ncbi:MAG TPA: hypothetical protein VI653_00145 [Steroidobacteraceae bacterium]
MNLLIRLIAIVFACAAAQAFAGDTPAAPDSTSKPVRSAPVVLQDKTLTQEEVNRMLSQGYKPKKGRGDDVLYCRSEPQMGSHFEKTVCLTAQQIKQRTQDSREITDKLEMNAGNQPGH